MESNPTSTLPKTNIAMENPPFWWYLQGNMGIFMGELLVSGRVITNPRDNYLDLGKHQIADLFLFV